MLVLGFPTMGVPAIRVGDVRVPGTRWIARALDELYPDRPLLFPTDPAERREVEHGRALGRGTAELGAADGGVIGGEQLNAADFQIAVNVSALLLSDDLTPFVEGRPAAALARRVLPDYVGHIGPIVPEEWMDELRAAAGETRAIEAQPSAGGTPGRRRVAGGGGR